MSKGWRGSECADWWHRGRIGGRCAECGKRRPANAAEIADRAARAWAASIIHWEQPIREVA
jgi:hypothetical protein